MKKPLKPGDKVAAYGHETHGEFIAAGNRGVVLGEHKYTVSLNNDQFVDVRFGDKEGFNFICTFHTKQLRRLKPKKDPRWFWLLVLNNGTTLVFSSLEETKKYQNCLTDHPSEIIRVREFPLKSKGYTGGRPAPLSVISKGTLKGPY